MKNDGRELTVEEKAVVHKAVALLALGLDVSSAPDKWGMLRAAVVNVGAVVGGVGIANALYQEVGVTTEPNRIVEARVVQNIMTSPELWQTVGARSSQIGGYLKAYRNQIEPKVATFVSSLNVTQNIEGAESNASIPSGLSVENKVMLLNVLLGPDSFPAILKVMSDSGNSLVELIESSKNSREDGGYILGSFGDSINKLGINPDLVVKLLPVVKGVLDKLVEHQKPIAGLVKEMDSVLRDGLNGKPVNFRAEQQQKAFERIGGVLFGRENGIIIPIISALEQNPSMVVEIAEKLNLKEILKAVIDLDLDKAEHKKVVTDIVRNIVVEIAKSPEARRNIENIISILSTPDMQKTDRDKMIVNEVAALLTDNSSLSVILPMVLKQNIVAITDLIVATPAIDNMLDVAGIKLDNSAQRQALYRIIEGVLDIAINLSFVEKDKELYKKVLDYLVNPAPEKVVSLVKDLAEIFLKNPVLIDNIVQFFSKDNVEAFRPIISAITKDNKLISDILSDTDLSSAFIQSFVSRDSLGTAITALSNLSSNGVVEKLSKGAFVELENRDFNALFSAAINVLQATNTDKFFEGNKDRISALVNKSAENLDPKSRDLISRFTPILIDVAKRGVDPQNINKIAELREDFIKLLDPRVPIKEKITSLLAIAQKELEIIEYPELQSFVKNNRKDISQALYSALEKSDISDANKNRLIKKIEDVLSVCENPKAIKGLAEALKNPRATQILEKSMEHLVKGNEVRHIFSLVMASIHAPSLMRVGLEVKKGNFKSKLKEIISRKKSTTSETKSNVAPSELQGAMTERGKQSQGISR